MVKKRSLVIALASAIILTGCTGIQEIRDRDVSKMVAAEEKKLREQFENQPSVVKVKIPKGAFHISGLNHVKETRTIDVSFDNKRFDTILNSVAKALKLNIVYDTSDTPVPVPLVEAAHGANGVQVAPQVQQQPAPAQQQAAASKLNHFASANATRMSITYSGTLQGFFELMSKKTGVFFVVENDTILVKNEEVFNVIVPTYHDLLKEIGANLEKIGVRDVAYDALSSTLTFRANYTAYVKAAEYINKMRENSSLVTLRIALFGVQLKNDSNAGIDWSQFILGTRAQSQNPFGLQSINNNATNSLYGTNYNTNGSVTSSNTTTTGTGTNGTIWEQGLGILANSVGANIYVQQARFTMALFANFMEQFGTYRVMQNVSLQTLSGKEGKIEILTESPYVSQIGVAPLTTNNTTTSATQSTAQTEKAKSGVTMEILPNYSRGSEILGVKLKIGVYGVTRYINLSAGNLGVFTQPETTKRTIDTYLRMRPDQIAIIGGLIYEQENEDARGLPIDTYLTKAVTKNKQKEELVVMVKPVVIEFVPE